MSDNPYADWYVLKCPAAAGPGAVGRDDAAAPTPTPPWGGSWLVAVEVIVDDGAPLTLRAAVDGDAAAAAGEFCAAHDVLTGDCGAIEAALREAQEAAVQLSKVVV